MENFVYPGVFTQEKDQTFLPQGISEIGGAFIGATTKGRAFVPTVVESWNDYLKYFGPTSRTSYLPYSVYYYLQDSERATIVRVLGTSGYESNVVNVVASGSYGKRSIAVLHPSYIVTNYEDTWDESTLSANLSGSAVIRISGSGQSNIDSDFTYTVTDYSASIDPSNDNYLGKIFGKSAETSDPVYLYTLFGKAGSASLAEDGSTLLELESTDSTDWDFGQEYSEAYTPWITSQLVGGNKVNLFKFATLSHGNSANFEIKIGIKDVIPAGSIPGSEYGQFTVEVRGVDQDNITNTPFTYTDSDTKPLILESFTCNLDPDSPLYIGKMIGTKYEKIDSNGDIEYYGEYKNRSSYMRVELNEDVEAKSISTQLVPFGFRALYSPIPNTYTQPTAATYVTSQTSGGIYNKNVYWGFNFDFNGTDNLNYLSALPKPALQTTGSNADFILSNYNQPADAGYPSLGSPYSGSINLNTSQTDERTRKFIVPFQGGFDGWKPNLRKLMGDKITATNTQGYDISSVNASGYTAFKRGLDAVSNADAYDINMIVTPGVLHQFHPSITNYAITVAEERSDCFYIMDGFDIDANVATAVATVETLDTNYAGTYYPWVKIEDPSTGKPTWCPPSVVIPSVFAYTDKVSEPWFSPAGLNRGALTEVTETRKVLRTDDLGDLYKGKVNPLKTTTGVNISVWGQKTLQSRPSAFDRINVRRLLIATKKFISSSALYLVFEQNTTQTRNKFINIVNPYLERVRQRQGLYDFRVVMDETNNTNEVIDRNILVGEIYLQPTKTAEFINIGFNIQPTGAVFAE